jgi:adenylate kinase
LTERTGTSRGAGLEQATKISAIPKGSPVAAKDFINLTEFMTGRALKKQNIEINDQLVSNFNEILRPVQSAAKMPHSKPQALIP